LAFLGEGSKHLLTFPKAHIVRRDPREELTVKMQRVKTDELTMGGRNARNFLETSRATQFLLRTLGVFGVSLVMADGIITPAQSVLGAIQGLKVVNEDISSATIVGVSCTILILLFLIQPFGTTKIASSFAPIVIVWLTFNCSFGIYVRSPLGSSKDHVLTLCRTWPCMMLQSSRPSHPTSP
jgi:KUP system potassium uptake protein